MTSDFEFAGDIMELSCFIRKIKQEEIEKALFLVWQVFREYEAPDKWELKKQFIMFFGF